MGGSQTIGRQIATVGGCAALAVFLGAGITGGYGLVAAATKHQGHHGCALLHCFSVTASASSLSGFAGVLTALTFTAIVFLLGINREDRSEIQSTVTLFTVAFVSLILATYLYTDAAAEEAASFRAAAVSFAASVALGIALLQLFLGIAHLVRQQGDATFFCRVASWFIGPAVFYFLMATAVNAWGLEMTSYTEWHSALARGTEILLTIWIFVALLPRPMLGYLKPATWATLSLGVVAIATFFVGYWGEEAPNAAIAPGVYFGAMVVVLLLGLGYSSLLKKVTESHTA